MFDDAALALEEIEPEDKTRNSSTELSGTPDREHSGARAQKLELVRIRDLLVEMTQLCAECMRYLVQRSLAFPLILQADY